MRTATGTHQLDGKLDASWFVINIPAFFACAATLYSLLLASWRLVKSEYRRRFREYNFLAVAHLFNLLLGLYFVILALKLDGHNDNLNPTSILITIVTFMISRVALVT